MDFEDLRAEIYGDAGVVVTSTGTSAGTMMVIHSVFTNGPRVFI